MIGETITARMLASAPFHSFSSQHDQTSMINQSQLKSSNIQPTPNPSQEGSRSGRAQSGVPLLGEVRGGLSSRVHIQSWRSRLPLTLLLAAIIGFTSCSSKPTTPGRSTFTRPGAAAANVPAFGGEVVTDTASVTATITAVDRGKRQVVLKRTDGGTNTYRATPQAVGFDRLKAGDRVRLSVAEEIAVFSGTNGVPTTADSGLAPTNAAQSARLRARLPANSLAILTEVVTLTYIGQIAALDDWKDTVTLQLPGGLTRTIHVSEYVNLATLNVGDGVSVRVDQAAALELDKP